MTSLVNPNAFVPAVPIPPVAPNFIFCHRAYGNNLRPRDGLTAASMLPQGAMPVTYSVEEPEMENHAANVSASDTVYSLPFLEIYAGIAISVDVSGPIDIKEIDVVPNDIRGMAAIVANQCLGRQLGGFVTRKFQGLVDFVTDPTSDLDNRPYPDSAAFLTLTVSNLETSASFPGDFDPEFAKVLWKSELDALERVEPHLRPVITDRIQRFVKTHTMMRRLGTRVVWWESELEQGNRTAITSLQLTNTTTGSVATARRRRRVTGLSH